LRAPALAVTVLPLAVLLGGLWSFAVLAGRGELTVMRASGVATRALLARLLPLTLLLGAGNALLVDRAAAWSERALARAFGKAADVPAAQIGDRFAARIDGEVVVAHLDRRDGSRLAEVTIIEFDAQGRIVGRLEASSAMFTGAGWRLDEVRRPEAPGAAPADHVAWSTPLSPATVQALAAGDGTISAAEAARALAVGDVAVRSEAYYRLRVAQARAAVAVPTVMLLLAALAGFATGRGDNGLGLAALGFGLGLAFVAAGGAFGAFGQIGMLSPTIAAYGPPGLFAAVGAATLTAMER
jgi:lipopolysaccharide export system permease protein